jgi:hypothetical protein
LHLRDDLDVSIMDAKPNDVLKFFGIPLTGGSQMIPVMALPIYGLNPLWVGVNNLAAGLANPPMYFDNLLPFMTYTMKGNDLHIVNLFSVLSGSVFTAMYPGSPPASSGALALVGVLGGAAGMMLGMLLPMMDELWNTLSATIRLLKGIGWSEEKDPLVLDLDGDGLETVALGDQAVYFDTNQDFFGERTGWLSGDDGFLTLDRNGNGRIDDLFEMFGPESRRGFARLTIWQDLDQNRATDQDTAPWLAHAALTAGRAAVLRY